VVTFLRSGIDGTKVNTLIKTNVFKLINPAASIRRVFKSKRQYKTLSVGVHMSRITQNLACEQAHVWVTRASGGERSDPAGTLISRVVKRAGPSKNCDAVDWGLLRRADSAYLHSNLDFYRNSTRLPSIWISNFFWCIFCSEAMGKNEFFRVENRTSNFALWMSKICSR